jgi:hypothetical protein
VQALRRLRPELELFLERYAPHVGRDEDQDHRFGQGLLLGGDRRSVEHIAEAIDGCGVRSLESVRKEGEKGDWTFNSEVQSPFSPSLRTDSYRNSSPRHRGPMATSWRNASDT